jgi:hypothetical protein
MNETTSDWWFRSFRNMADGPRYVIIRTPRLHITLRFGIERRPLFSERNPQIMTKRSRWTYLFGRRVSWRWQRRDS